MPAYRCQSWESRLAHTIYRRDLPFADLSSPLDDRRTRNLRAVRLLLAPPKLESTVRYLGIDVDDALRIAERPRRSVAVLVAAAELDGR
jgi:hypothetical protein